MKNASIILIACWLQLSGASPIQGQSSYPPDLPEAIAEVYKSVDGVELSIFRYEPPNHKASDRVPAIVFFFGGGWSGGTPQQFEHQCRYLASRGLVTMTADYRVSSRHQTKALQCVLDAKSAIRWVRKHATRLGVDPNRIIASGGSAGGHIAACTGLIEGIEELTEDLTVSSKPNAMILFNPVLALDSVPGRPPLDPDKLARRAGRLGIAPRNLSPLHHIKPSTPPTLILHGLADRTVPYWTAEAFQTLMGDRCRLAGYPDQPHGFFNYGRSGNRFFRQTMTETDRFLVSLGYLKGPVSVDEYLKDPKLEK